MAAAGGRSEVIELLIAHGARVDEFDRDGLTPLCYAASSGDAPTVRRLLEAGANARGPAGVASAPILRVAGYETVHVLKKYGADVNVRGSVMSDTPLHQASSRYDAETVRALLELGADPHVTNRHSQTPLDIVKESGHCEVTSHGIINTSEHSDVEVLLRAAMEKDAGDIGSDLPEYEDRDTTDRGSRSGNSR